jgi:tRNA(fMet)-specific endonuclease VapC
VILALDANVVVDVMRRRTPVVGCWQAAVSSGARFVVSSIVMHELEAGADLSARPDIQRARLREVFAEAQPCDFDLNDARISGRVRARLQIGGVPIGPLDTLIAGQALARGWTLVTRNIKHFGRVEGLPLIDWSVGPDVLSADQTAARVAEA